MMALSLRRKASAEYRVPHAVVEDFMDEEAEARLMIARFADRAPTDSDWELMTNGLSAFIQADGEIPLERCLKIPSTHGARRKLKRDGWLRKAALMIDAESSWTGSVKLKAEWDKFISRGPWQAWRDEECPPSEATPLSEALFWATRCNRSESLTVKQIARIVGHIFTEKCR